MIFSTTALPPPEQFYQDFYGLAWPQITAFSSAVVGILIIGMVVNSLRG